LLRSTSTDITLGDAKFVVRRGQAQDPHAQDARVGPAAGKSLGDVAGASHLALSSGRSFSARVALSLEMKIGAFAPPISRA
jgi:hypothetical protein